VPQLISVTVEKLLGRFDHHITFDPTWEFVILHGPNGVGKTKLLELIYAVSSCRFGQVAMLPFVSAHFSYDDQSTVSLQRVGQLSLPGVPQEDPGATELHVRLTRAGAVLCEFPINHTTALPPENQMRVIERELPVERLAIDLWHDHQTGDQVPTREIIERYKDLLPANLVSNMEGIPPEYEAFARDTPVHLIETQRLLAARVTSPRRPVRELQPQMTVTRYSADLTERLRVALAENSTTSQDLDRTFPRRVITAPKPKVTDGQIRDRYNQQGALRDRLATVSLLDAATADLTLPDRELEDWERRVLWTYLDDTERKLATFQPLLDRVQLLQEIVNSRFLFKRLVIDRARGFTFVTDDAGEIGPASLSSGEQHELVLGYDLLFNVAEGSMVLIDEPEISLHVSWQQQFLNDLIKIANLQKLRFVIATHSPQVIHKWWDRAEALYEDDTAPEAAAPPNAG